jgi:molybdate transport system substrate-binding protein
MTHLAPRVLALLCGACLSLACHAAELTVSAAASLSNALRDVAPLFEAAHPGTRVQFNFAASGALLQQLVQGAPVDVFVSADQQTMDQAQVRGLVVAAQRHNVVANTLVVIVPAASAKAPKALAELTQAAYPRVAIGLPASVPAGRYAKAALEAAGMWAAIEARMIGVQTPRQALDYAARGEVEAAFVYATDAALMPAKVRVAFVVPTIQPILYPAAPLAASPNPALAQRFVEFLLAPQAQAVLARFGFGSP